MSTSAVADLRHLPGRTVVPEPQIVVVNGRASGVGDADATAARAVRALRAAGGEATSVVTRTDAELARVVRVAAASGRRLVLVGGDGGVHAVANLPRPLPELALVPAGRANNIARALAIPTLLDAAARLAVHAPARRVDALLVETPLRTVVAVEGVSAGFHAGARHRYHADNSAALGEGVRALADELAVFRPYRGTVDLDGAGFHAGPLAQAFLANLPLFGFGFRVDPFARADDGLLDAIVLRARTRAGVVRLLAAARTGRHLGRPDVSWARATHARLTTAMPLVADAEPLGVTTARVAALPGHLRIAAPEAASPVLAAAPPRKRAA